MWVVSSRVGTRSRGWKGSGSLPSSLSPRLSSSTSSSATSSPPRGHSAPIFGRYTVALVFVSLLFVPLRLGGMLSLVTALVAGAGFLACGLAGLRQAAGSRWARSEFAASLLYLTVLFGMLMFDRASSL